MLGLRRGKLMEAWNAWMLISSPGSITSLLHRHWELDPVIRGGMVSIATRHYWALNSMWIDSD